MIKKRSIFSIQGLILPFMIISFVMPVFSDNGISDKNASGLSIQLYKNLWRQLNKGVMLGHQDALSYGVNWHGEKERSDIKDVSGDYPAVFGWDLGGIELGHAHNLDSVYFENIKENIIRVHAMGGVNTISWHLMNTYTKGNSWDVSSTKSVAEVLPGGVCHSEFKNWLDKLAEFLNALENEDGEKIPVLFRPYHEFTGDWFWWGAKNCDKDEFVELFQYTIDYLRNQKNIHHLLIVYSAGDFNDLKVFKERYPGDTYVDLVGFDSYQYGSDEMSKSKYIKLVRNELNLLVEFAKQHKKIPALTETGLECVSDSTWFTTGLHEAIRDFKISYCLLWRNAYNRKNHFYVPYTGHNSTADFNLFIKKRKVKMLNETIDLYK